MNIKPSERLLEIANTEGKKDLFSDAAGIQFLIILDEIHEELVRLKESQQTCFCPSCKEERKP